MDLGRRDVLAGVGATAGVLLHLSSAKAADVPRPEAPDARALAADDAALTNAKFLADRFIAWQSPYGGPDPARSPYRSGGTGAILQGIGPQVRALYRLFETTADDRYKHAADRHATFYLAAVHDPWEPYASVLSVTGKSQFALSAAWIYGKGFSPCFEWFRKHNPTEDSFDVKAHAMYRWLQFHRREDSRFGVGYPIPGFEDAQFSCDLGEVGTGLLGFYRVTNHEPAIADALALAQLFLTEHVPGSGKGLWSSKIGAWLVGPWPGGGAEHFTDQKYDEVSWGWSCLVVGEFLLELRRFEAAADLRADIDAKCVQALRWCIDQCQFEDGAHGMFGRDDKWVGQGAAAILLYAKLREQSLVQADVDATYLPKLRKSWEYLLAHTSASTFPEHGYTRVTGRTTTNPPENLLWMMAWTVEALLAGRSLFT